MSVIPTKTPVFNEDPSIHFFNGRLLTGEDMTTEQAWNNVRRKLLGQAMGSGVAFGLEVNKSNKPEHAGLPIVTIKQGMAINREGETLSLTQNANVSLVHIDEATTTKSDFEACQPIQYSAHVKSNGVYLLTICPAAGTQGKSPVMGLANTEARCNRKYRLDGVQFRLHQLKLASAELSDTNRIRNLVAYKIFNPQKWFDFVTNPFGDSQLTTEIPGNLLVPKLENSEVPLATVYWTTSGGIKYVDLWSVRRSIASQRYENTWENILSNARVLERKAAFLQFQEHVTSIIKNKGNLNTITAQSHFHFLPAVGFISVPEETDKTDAMATRFFAGMTYRNPAFINGARLESLMCQSLDYPPIDVSSKELVWLYRVRENRMAIDYATTNNEPQSYLVFSSGHIPYQADAQFDVARFDYTNFARVR